MQGSFDKEVSTSSSGLGDGCADWWRRWPAHQTMEEVDRCTRQYTRRQMLRVVDKEADASRGI